jgi:hypothetical protein
MSYASTYQLNPADRIVTPWLQTGLTKHHAIYLGFNDYGQELIAENDTHVGVSIVTAQQFAQEHPVVSRIEKFKGNYFQRNAAVRTAVRLEGKLYDLFSYNCEHYANQVQHGRAESQQVRNFFLLAGLVAFGFILAGDNR